MEAVKKGEQIAEGKTKIIYAVDGNTSECVVFSKDRITAGNAAK